ncbi:hypothetical protein VTP01DRAFT_5250 [Rhizomucor pusillus]|uniref:uncharacterized protein n=1 Tax=Rhizomucor pusillus TaxID=4840 RepID=UPI00374206AE
MDEPDITLTSLSLTHVQFDRNDKLAYALAYITLAPLAILVFYASVIVSRRELAVIFALAGQLLNEGLNAILKETLQIARPSAHLGTGYGMPSSHAQFIWYFAVYGSTYLWFHIRLDHSAWKTLLTVAMTILATLVCYSRIYLGYHSEAQVAVGSVIGCTFAVIWYTITEKIFRQSGFIDYVLKHPLAEWIYLRDMRSIDNVAKWEYHQWRRHLQTKNVKST